MEAPTLRRHDSHAPPPEMCTALLTACGEAEPELAQTIGRMMVNRCSETLGSMRTLEPYPEQLLEVWRSESRLYINGVEHLLKEDVELAKASQAAEASGSRQPGDSGASASKLPSMLRKPSTLTTIELRTPGGLAAAESLLKLLAELRETEERLVHIYKVFDDPPWYYSDVNRGSVGAPPTPSPSSPGPRSLSPMGGRPGADGSTPSPGGNKRRSFASDRAGALLSAARRKSVDGGGGGGGGGGAHGNGKRGAASHRVSSARTSLGMVTLPPLLPQLPPSGLDQVWLAKLSGCAGWTSELLRKCRKLNDQVLELMPLPSSYYASLGRAAMAEAESSVAPEALGTPRAYPCPASHGSRPRLADAPSLPDRPPPAG